MWLILQAIREAIDHARTSGVEATAEQSAKFMALHGDGAGAPSRILSIAGNNAEIHIDGVLTDVPDFFAQFFGGGNTTYSEIVQALAEAQADPVVDNITLRINSPGGTVNGLFDALSAIKATSKPVKAVVRSLAASGAFAVAAQADSIVAENQMTQFGAVGVVATFLVLDEEVTITSTKAPEKAPDVTTPEGAAIIRKQLDAVHDVFVSSIAEGRDTTEATINSDFGRGALILAADALTRGMIDSILDDDLGATETDARNEPGESTEARAMDLNELQREHPDVYAQAVQVGTDAEKDRVTAHITYGQGFGCMDIAVKAISDGASVSEALKAEYATAGRNQTDLEAVAGDDVQSADATEGVALEAKAEAQIEADKVADTVASALGLSTEV